MPRKKSDREKKAAGTYRPDREGPPLPVAEAQAALSAVTVKLAEAQKQAAGLTGRKAAKVAERCRILTTDVELATEDLFKAMKAAEARAAAPSIRKGLELMSYNDCMNAQPPLSDAEGLEWLAVGPTSDYELARRKQNGSQRGRPRLT